LSRDGKRNERDVIRHNGSVVILAIDNSKSKKNPWIVMERQYRHAANQYLWELPAGKQEPGEDPLAGSQAGTGRGDRIPREEVAAAG
jgi:ADP-ribose pyrophosphatase